MARPTERIERIVSPSPITGDERIPEVRPRCLSEFIGNEKVIRQLAVLVKASKESKNVPGHIIFTGAPGVGKTTLAYILSKELGLRFSQALGHSLKNPDIIRLLAPFITTSGILFIDELANINGASAILCKAMEEFTLINIVGAERKLRPFTLVSATTDFGSIPPPLRDRFTYILHLDYYTNQELSRIVELSAQKISVELGKGAALEIASRARGTPRIAIRLLRRCKDFSTILDVKSTRRILRDIGIDEFGLDEWDRRYIEILKRFDGGPVGLTTIAGILGESEDTVEQVIEPYLLRRGLVIKTTKGRMLTGALL